jgi:hypothetical protein
MEKSKKNSNPVCYTPSSEPFIIYEFIYCDTGTNGRISDEGVNENTKFYEKFVGGHLQLPPPRKRKT